MGSLNETAQSRVDEALKIWRQGDFVLGQHRFLFRPDADTPLTEAGREAIRNGVSAAEDQTIGLALVSNSCDIVRSCCERPFLQVCPLIEVSADVLREARRGYRRHLGFLSGAAEHGLVVDLDRVMTVEKAVVAGWNRVRGLNGNDEERRFRFALERYRGRAPFPDDFGRFMKRLSRRISRKHDAGSAEGDALRALREIRVRAEPSWHADEVGLTFLFIRDEGDQQFGGSTWDTHLEQWLELIPASGRFTSVDGLVPTLDDVSGREYVESDRLDLDHLTIRDP